MIAINFIQHGKKKNMERVKANCALYMGIAQREKNNLDEASELLEKARNTLLNSEDLTDKARFHYEYGLLLRKKDQKDQAKNCRRIGDAQYSHQQKHRRKNFKRLRFFTQNEH